MNAQALLRFVIFPVVLNGVAALAAACAALPLQISPTEVATPEPTEIKIARFVSTATPTLIAFPTLSIALTNTPTPTPTRYLRTFTPTPPSRYFFDYKAQVLGPPSALVIVVDDLNTSTGQVRVNGGEPERIQGNFRFDWGDGSVDQTWFPASHTYSDRNRNYTVRASVTYLDGRTGVAETIARFMPPSVRSVPLSPALAVTIPNYDVRFTRGAYGTGSKVTFFDDSFFRSVPRSSVEYVLSVAASIQYDLVNDDVQLYDGKFIEALVRDPGMGGGYSLWYTTPVAVAMGDVLMRGAIPYSSLFHEMGHNFTLNTPSKYPYGPIIGGQGNAIYSETMAQISAHVTAYEIINQGARFGLSDDLVAEIKQGTISTMRVVRSNYHDYLSSGKKFKGWNGGGAGNDETLKTFMTLAYKFFEHAERAGTGYRAPAKRMLKLLQVLDSDLGRQYNSSSPSPEAETFRSTLMVTALSYAFSQDLRAEFRELNFPINDNLYTKLYRLANAQ